MTTFPLTWPAGIVPREITWEQVSIVGMARSPWTGQTQVQAHQGQWWRAALDFPPMGREKAQPLIARLSALKGMEGTILIGPTAEDAPLGDAQGTPVIDGGGQAGSDILTRGWDMPPDVVQCDQTDIACDSELVTCDEAAVVLDAGDWIGLGDQSGASARLHRLTQAAEIESAFFGTATLSLWPAVTLAQALHDGDAVTVDSPVGVFRLTENVRGWSLGEARLYGFSLGFESVV